MPNATIPLVATLLLLLVTATCVLGSSDDTFAHKQSAPLVPASSDPRSAFGSFLYHPELRKLFVGTYDSGKIYMFTTSNATCSNCLDADTANYPLTVAGYTKFTNAVRIKDNGYFVGDVAGRILKFDLTTTPVISKTGEFSNISTSEFFRACLNYNDAYLICTTFHGGPNGDTAPHHIYMFNENLVNYFRAYVTMRQCHSAVSSGGIGFFVSAANIYKYDLKNRFEIGSPLSLPGDKKLSKFDAIAVYRDWIFAVGSGDGIRVVRYTASSTTSDNGPLDASSEKVFVDRAGTNHSISAVAEVGGNLYLADASARLHRFSTTSGTVTAHALGTTDENNYVKIITNNFGAAFVLCNQNPVRVAVFSGIFGESATTPTTTPDSGPDSVTIAIVVIIVLCVVAILCCIVFKYVNQDADEQNRQFEADIDAARHDNDLHNVAAGDDANAAANGDARVSHSIRRLDDAQFTDLSQVNATQGNTSAAAATASGNRYSPKNDDDNGGVDGFEMQPPFSPPPR